ncbi:MAG: VWA domain-containing protein [Betaproteobacteria bacterium]|nr:VWA domain-containing protein [Betaproteobacteria bacterium]
MDSAGDVKRFVIPGEEGYSDFWRRDKSPIEPIELVKLLVAIRKVASFIGRNVGEIVWSGMEVENAVALNPTPIMGTYPVPAAKTDLMIGIMVQEAYKRIEWSERLREMFKLRVQPPAQYEYKFDMFFTVCEYVYVDSLANKSVLGYYAEAARDWRIIRTLKSLIKPPTLSEMLYLWWRLAGSRDPERYKEGHSDLTLGGLVTRGSLDQYYAKPMETMNSIVLPLRHECQAIPSVSGRCDFRLDLYEKLWREVLKYIRFWPGDRSDKFMIPDMGEEDLAQEEEEQKAVKATIVNYANLIEAELPQKNKDFTEQVKGNVAKFETVVRIEGNDIVMMARNRVDAKLLRQIEQVVRSATDRRSVFNRGLTSGKIHRRRLYRALTTGAVFQEKKHEFELRKNVVLLVDATGSMADPTKWDKAEMIYQTLFTALLSYTANARLFAYNEVKNACRITELYRGGRMLMVLPHGKTASGEAIIATALSTRTPGKKTLLIHLTDGASNWGCGVEDAIKFCRKNSVSLLTLGISCGFAAKQALRDEYGKLVQFVDQTEQLPRLFGELIVTEMREARMPQK